MLHHPTVGSSSWSARLYKVEPCVPSTSSPSSVSHTGLVFQPLQYPKLLSASSVASAGPAAWNAIAPELVWAGGSFVRFQLKCSFPWEPPPSLASLFSLSSNFPASSHLCNYWFINLFLLTGKFREGRNSLSLLFSAISPEPSPGPGTEGTLICLLGKSVLTKGRNYWQRKRGNVPIWCFGFMLTVC